MLAGFRVNICNFWMYFTFTVLLSFKQPYFPHHILSLARRVAIGLSNETPESAVHLIDIKHNYIFFGLVCWVLQWHTMLPDLGVGFKAILFHSVLFVAAFLKLWVVFDPQVIPKRNSMENFIECLHFSVIFKIFLEHINTCELHENILIQG